jgi:hypothetical protein
MSCISRPSSCKAWRYDRSCAVFSSSSSYPFLPYFPAPSLFLVGGTKPEKAADCAYASSPADLVCEGARVRVGGARLEKAADCPYASDGDCVMEDFWDEEEISCEREEEKK